MAVRKILTKSLAFSLTLFLVGCGPKYALPEEVKIERVYVKYPVPCEPLPVKCNFNVPGFSTYNALIECIKEYDDALNSCRGPTIKQMYPDDGPLIDFEEYMEQRKLESSKK